MLLTFGMSTVLSLWAPNPLVLWSHFLGPMLLGFLGAAAASTLSGLLVLPSLASEAAMRSLITALRKTGQTSSLCVSILLRPESRQGEVPWELVHQQQPRQPCCHKRQSSTSSATSSSNSSRGERSNISNISVTMAAAPAGDACEPMVATLGVATVSSSSTTGTAAVGAAAGQEQAEVACNAAVAAAAPASSSAAAAELPVCPVALPMIKRGSLVEEVPVCVGDPTLELDRMLHITQPGHWGLTSFVVKARSSHSLASLADNGSCAAMSVHLQNQAAAAEPAAAAPRDGPALSQGQEQTNTEPEQMPHHPLCIPQLSLSSPSKGRHSGNCKSDSEEPHMFVRLQRSVDHIRPLLANVRALHEAMVVEQAWWVRWATVGPGCSGCWRVSGSQHSGCCQAQTGAGLTPGLTAAGLMPVRSWVRLVDALSELLDR